MSISLPHPADDPSSPAPASSVAETVIEDEDEEPSIPVPDHLNESQLSFLTDKNFYISIQSVSIPPDSELEDEEDEPEAVFEVREHVVKTGSKKGQIEKKIVLTIGSYTFKKRYKMRNGNLLFTCNSCQKLNHYLSAVVEIQDQEADLYSLLSAPSPNDHVCWVTGYQQTIKRAKNEMCSKVS